MVNREGSSLTTVTYADQLTDWLSAEGYTHCFFVAGGNIMHLLNAARSRFTCIPFVHEVAAGIAAEYFNESRSSSSGRAFALVTAGPGLTNIVTALAGAFLESRELLVIGGQVKSSDLATDGLRQRGIQEIDGLAIAQPVCVATLAITRPLPRSVAMTPVIRSRTPRMGPAFIEVTLDAQGAPCLDEQSLDEQSLHAPPGDFPMIAEPQVAEPSSSLIDHVAHLLMESSRPVLLIGAGVSRQRMRDLLPDLERLGIPICTTWNAADRIGADHPQYFGRPNTWGMRWSNVLVQQADLVIAVGTRLGLQQTGFNWQQFAPGAEVVHVDLDRTELAKGHPRTTLAVESDAGTFLDALVTAVLALTAGESMWQQWESWRAFGAEVRRLLPLADPANVSAEGFVDPYRLLGGLSQRLSAHDVVIPCSSGGAFTVPMQALEQRAGQVIVSNKGLASMGYGLAGAIGAALANPGRRTVLIEGDGGFAQNLQEVGTLAAQHLPVKIFLFANDGYASIRMTQRNYFNGAYVGCDSSTGLGLPGWPLLFAAYDLRTVAIDPQDPWSDTVLQELASPDPVVFIVPIDPE
jgi:acetolactate synthase-1/2/3 large subunit